MNYLAHLFLAQPTPASCFGNLLSDFQKGVDIQALPSPVHAALQTHKLVDKFTDQHPLVVETKAKFSSSRRRFAGVTLDVLFDHFLIAHWQQFTDQSFETFCQQRYALLSHSLPDMPARMQHVVGSMVKEQWLDVYATLDGVSEAINRTARRIRFRHQFNNSIEEVEPHYAHLHRAFPDFFNALTEHVQQQSTE